MRTIFTMLACCVIAGIADASPVVRVYTVYPVDFGDNHIRHSYQLIAPFRFQRGDAPAVLVRTPIHAAVRELYHKVEKIDMRGSQRPTLGHIEFTNGIVRVHSKNERPDSLDVRQSMRICLKLTIGETLSIRSRNPYQVAIPDIKGFQMVYKDGTVFPKIGYYAVVEAIKKEGAEHPNRDVFPKVADGL